MKVVVALGGNALLLRGERGSAEEQMAHVESAAEGVMVLLREGHTLLVTHGNGPQVGDILLKNECARDTLPRMPLDVCGAESQGMIGYMIQQALGNRMRREGPSLPVITVITQTLVDTGDPAFSHPAKPVGPYYPKEEADHLAGREGWMFREFPGGFRRVVPSPVPLGVVEAPSLAALVRAGFLVVAGGGGGVPVVRTTPGGALRGVEAVVDKDLTAVCLATAVRAEVLLILTDVPCAYTGFSGDSPRPLASLRAGEAEFLLAHGEFGEGTMGPKIAACIRFVRMGGRAGIIAALADASPALSGKTGTRILP